MTKSGTNTLRGNAYLYFRDKSLNARNYFERFDVFGNPVNLEKAPYSQKQWGATLGGPIKRDRTFFFVSQERTDIKDNRVVTIDPAAADDPGQRRAFRWSSATCRWLSRTTRSWGRWTTIGRRSTTSSPA